MCGKFANAVVLIAYGGGGDFRDKRIERDITIY